LWGEDGYDEIAEGSVVEVFGLDLRGDAAGGGGQAESAERGVETVPPKHWEDGRVRVVQVGDLGSADLARELVTAEPFGSLGGVVRIGGEVAGEQYDAVELPCVSFQEGGFAVLGAQEEQRRRLGIVPSEGGRSGQVRRVKHL
jgi:hypothetical protein